MSHRSVHDWWEIIRRLMHGGELSWRAYTRQEVGRMTLMDLRLILNERPGRSAVPAGVGSTPADRARAALDRKAAILAKRDSWEV